MEYLINADDFGRTSNTNRAIIEGFKAGYIDRSSIMVNTPGFAEAIKLAKDNDLMDRIGLHFNIVTGVPLTEDIKRCKSFCENGRFNGKVFRSKRIKLFLFPKEMKAVKSELLAQISAYKSAGFTLMHFDSHGHVHTFGSVMPLCFYIAKMQGFHSIRLTLNYSAKGLKKTFKAIENSVLNTLNKKYKRDYLYFDSIQMAIKSFEKEKNNPGVFEVMIHPDYYDGIHRQIEFKHVYEDLDLFNEYRITYQDKV